MEQKEERGYSPSISRHLHILDHAIRKTILTLKEEPASKANMATFGKNS